MAQTRRLRDMIPAPVWLRNRPGFTVGYRFLWNVAAVFDTLIDMATQGAQAGWPGQGTPTALPYIGRTRRIVQGQTETNEHYAKRLVGWLETHANGRTKEHANQLHEYLGNNPRVRIVDRAGHWVTVNEDGSVVEQQAAWDWDSVTNPERAGNWWEIWIIVYPTQWAQRPGTFDTLSGTDDGFGIGHMVTRAEYDQVTAIVREWKGAHAYVRSIVWCDSSTMFDPSNPASLPDGRWGQWGYTATLGAPRVASNRDLVHCRYWEPVQP